MHLGSPQWDQGSPRNRAKSTSTRDESLSQRSLCKETPRRVDLEKGVALDYSFRDLVP